MNTLQWCGAITAILASITAAVAVRVWKDEPSQAKVRIDRD